MNNITVQHDTKTGTFTVMGDYPEFKHIMAFEYEAGRFINERDIAESRKVAVIGKAVREQLFAPGVDPIGKYVKISGVVLPGRRHHAHAAQRPDGRSRREHRVRAVHDAQDRVQHRQPRRLLRDDREARHRWPQLERRGPRGAVAPPPRLADRRARDRLVQHVRDVRQVRDVLVRARADVSWVVGGATLLAGVVGVSNIMLITVKERTKEIGVRKALGATPLSIVSMVMKESIVLTLIAGLVGVAAGVGLMALADAVLANATDLPFGPPNVGAVDRARRGRRARRRRRARRHHACCSCRSIKPIEALRAE